jgi:hypothetical protein
MLSIDVSVKSTTLFSRNDTELIVNFSMFLQFWIKRRVNDFKLDGISKTFNFSA